MVCLQRDAPDAEQWNQQLMHIAENHSEQFSQMDLCVRDQAVAPADLLRMQNTGHPSDAVLNVWCEHAHNLDAFLQQLSNLGKTQSYVVSESNVMPLERKVGRVAGMCQIAFIRKPAELSRADWQHYWLGEHTQLAIDTQSTFAYRQNVIANTLPYSKPQQDSWQTMHAIVEENFPAPAMTSREYFFAAQGDPALFEQRQQDMLQSCMRFIDFTAFDCVPMSQYVIKV